MKTKERPKAGSPCDLTGTHGRALGMERPCDTAQARQIRQVPMTSSGSSSADPPANSITASVCPRPRWCSMVCTFRAHAGELRFRPLPRPSTEEVHRVARWTHERLGRVLARHGRSLDEFTSDDAPDKLADEQPVLASCYGASVGDRQLLGAVPGERTRKLVHPVREVASPDEALADVGGVNVHLGAASDGRDRRRLERRTGTARGRRCRRSGSRSRRMVD
jgi:hypothetical protein